MTGPGGSNRRDRERTVEVSRRIYRVLMRAYPRDIRERYGEEMVGCFSDACRDAVRDSGPRGIAAVWLRALPDLVFTALKERSTMSDRNTYRSVVGLALATALILLVPLLAMRFTDEVNWTLFDFVFAGVLIFGTGFTYVLVAKRAGNLVYRAAVGISLAAAFILIWVTGAVGVIGTEDNPANLMYVGVLAVALTGAIVARFEPAGMARAMTVTAVAQGLVAVIALIYGLGSPLSGAAEIVLLNGFFIALWAGSAWLFRYAAREQTPAGAGSEG